MQDRVLKFAIFLAFQSTPLISFFLLFPRIHRFMQDFQLEVFEMDISLT